MANENNAVGGILLLLALLPGVISGKRRLPAGFSAGVAGFLAGAALLLLAPGLRARYQAEMAGADPVSLLNRLMMVPEIVAFWLLASLPCLPLLGAGLVLWLHHERSRLADRKQWRSVLTANRPVTVALLLVALSLTMALAFAVGRPPALRAYYSCFVINAVAAVILLRFLMEKYGQLRFGVLAALLAGTFVFAVTLPAWPDSFRIHRDQVRRDRLIAEAKATGERDLVVPPHTVQRRSLLHYIFVEDLTDDSCFWLNQVAASYYGVDSIRTSEKVEVKTFWRKGE